MCKENNTSKKTRHIFSWICVNENGTQRLIIPLKVVSIRCTKHLEKKIKNKSCFQTSNSFCQFRTTNRRQKALYRWWNSVAHFHFRGFIQRLERSIQECRWECMVNNRAFPLAFHGMNYYKQGAMWFIEYSNWSWQHLNTKEKLDLFFLKENIVKQNKFGFCSELEVYEAVFCTERFRMWW